MCQAILTFSLLSISISGYMYFFKNYPKVLHKYLGTDYRALSGTCTCIGITHCTIIEIENLVSTYEHEDNDFLLFVRSNC